jgi:hypothetical protein
MDEMPFGLARKDTYAALTAKDLESLGKEASNLYLSGGVSLNDAVIKLASQHPSISPHQVKRVVEFANTETFQRLFEKQAGDKNVDFDVADPGAILKSLELGSMGQVSVPTPSEYSSEPVKLGHREVEADIELCRMFGMEPVSPGMSRLEPMTKVASPAERILPNVSRYPWDRILQVKEAQMPLMEGPAPEAVGQTPEQVHLDQMLTMQRQLELEKKKQELATVQQKTLQLMAPLGTGMEGQEGQMGAEPSVAPPPDVAAAMQGAPMGGPPAGGGGVGPPQGMPQEMPMGPPSGPIPEKIGSALTKEALDYVKTGRKQYEFVLDDLRAATSVDRIKSAMADKRPDPESNPHGELLRLRHTVTKLAQDAVNSRDRNEFLLKEATAQWVHLVSQHIVDGGHIGEIAHIMGDIDPRFAKTAMEAAMPRLVEFGIEPAVLTAQSLHYEMTKGASRRRLNPENPIAQAYATLAKLAYNQQVLEVAATDLDNSLDEVTAAVQEALRASA